MRANRTRVWRQPTCSFRAWPTTQNTDEANAPNSVRYEIAIRPREGATCTSAANAASYRHSRMPRPRNTQTARYAAWPRTWARANRPADTSTVPSVMTARAAVPVDGAADRARDDAHGEQGDGEAEEDEAPAPARVLADRPRQHAEAVVARSPGGDLGDAERDDRAHHRIGEPRPPAGARGRAGGPGHVARGTRMRSPAPLRGAAVVDGPAQVGDERGLTGCQHARAISLEPSRMSGGAAHGRTFWRAT